jgi:DNA polymerase-3 subunit alpha
LSACLAGEISSRLSEDDYEAAKKTALEYRRIFGENNYFLEIQNHGIDEQRRIIPQLVRLSRETGIPLVATNDVHYIAREDAQLQRVLLCIQTGTTLDAPTDMIFPNDEFYMKDGDEMMELFSLVPEAVSNTVSIAERCSVDIETGKKLMPEYRLENGEDKSEFFKSICMDGLKKRYGSDPEQSICERLHYEISVISRMGYIDYFLIVWDFIRYARDHGIPVGPGRGSGAGSLCAYCIGITSIDPIKYNLIFERFLNPHRVSMPDFDIGARRFLTAA